MSQANTRSSLLKIWRGRRLGRRGSILILVVALLVLMALIGTAALSTNTTDRFATRQNSFNTQVDLIIEGVKKQAMATAVNDIVDTSTVPATYRPAGRNFTMPLLIDTNKPPRQMEPALAQSLLEQNSAWLSPRYPMPALPFARYELARNGGTYDPLQNPVVWQAIGAPLDRPLGTVGPGEFMFEAPGVFSVGTLGPNNWMLDPTRSRVYNTRVSDTDLSIQGATFIHPSSVTYQTVNGSQTHPAWDFMISTGTTAFSSPYRSIAADADGDGVADAGLVRVPIGEIDGVTYFYACRIVDNNSAINVNTAWSRDWDFRGDGSVLTVLRNSSGTPVQEPFVPNLYPSNIGMAELLRTRDTASPLPAFADDPDHFGAELVTAPGGTTGFNSFRFNTGTDSLSATDPWVGLTRANGVLTTGAFTPANREALLSRDGIYGGAFRTDYKYNSLSEALWIGLGRRLDSPAPSVAEPGTGTNLFSVPFRRLPFSDNAALAYRFTLQNPNASISRAEELFPQSLQQPPGLVGTSPVNVDTWFINAFDYDDEFNSGYAENATRYRTRRAMFVTDNAVAPACERTQLPPDWLPAAGYFGVVDEWPTNPVKASANTSNFRELVRAFYSVMAWGIDTNAGPTNGQVLTFFEQPDLSMYPTIPALPPVQSDMYAYTGNRFTQGPVMSWTPTPVPSAPVDFPPHGPMNAGTPYDQNQRLRMFRNSLRDHVLTAVAGSRLGNPTSASDATATGSNQSADALQFRPGEMVKLRAALAAVNTISMRAPENPAANPGPYPAPQTSFEPLDREAVQRIRLKAHIPGTPTTTYQDVDAWVYGVERQPYITEIYVNSDTVNPPRSGSGLPPNDHPYVAVELFYPYPTGPNGKSIAGWKLGFIERRERTGANNYQIDVVPMIINPANSNPEEFDGPDAVFLPNTNAGQQGSYIVLENYDRRATPGTAANGVYYRPFASGLPETGTPSHPANVPPCQYVYVQDLWRVIRDLGTAPTTAGGELVLLRPVFDAGTAPPAPDPRDLPPDKPIDSFDFTGMENISRATSIGVHSWRYSRPVVPYLGSVGGNRSWSFVYPGRYDGGLATRRHQGTHVGEWDLSDPAQEDPFGVIPVGRPTFGDLLGPTPTGENTYEYSFTYPPLSQYQTQLLNVDQPGWNPLHNPTLGGPNPTLANPNRFPFGAFARNVDMLQIPFFGSYCVRLPSETSTQTFVEVNALPMDTSFCDDTDLSTNEAFTQTAGAIHQKTFEQLGRFCPLWNPFGENPALSAYAVDDLSPRPSARQYYYHDPPGGYGNGFPVWRYQWAARLFDFLTVQDPQLDYNPNVKPTTYRRMGYYAGPTPTVDLMMPQPVSNAGAVAGNLQIVAEPATAPNPPLWPPVPVPGDTPGITYTPSWTEPTSGTLAGPPWQTVRPNNTENGVPTQGLININTASWRVLASINWTFYRPGDTRRDQWTFGLDPAGGGYALVAGGDGVDDNIQIAKLITWYRDGVEPSGVELGPRGPFRSIYDLYRVPGIRDYYNERTNRLTHPDEPDDADGDFSPQNTTTPPVLTDGVANDFEERYLLLNRVSNLITTRSDSFTVYIVVQGWTNVGSTDASKPPELVVQRRAAFIADRSTISATGGQLKVLNVATE